MIEADLVALLKADGAVAALAGTRIFPEPAPQGVAFPAITYRRISGQRDYSLDGHTGLATARFQFDCWAMLFAQARALADAVSLALEAWTLADARIQTDLDTFEPDAELQRVIVDAEFLYDT